MQRHGHPPRPHPQADPELRPALQVRKENSQASRSRRRRARRRGSPRLLRTGTRREGRQVDAERREEGGERRAERAAGAVLALERDAEAVAVRLRRGGLRRRPSRTSRARRASAGSRRRRGRRRGPGARASRRRRGSPPGSCSKRANACAIRSSGSAKVTTPQPSVAVGELVRVDVGGLGVRGAAGLLHRMVGQAVALGRPAVRAAEGEHAGVLAGAVVEDLSAAGGPPAGRARGRPRSAGAFASSARTAAIWSSVARCEAEAIARSRSSRSSRARASGSAWIGFDEERMKHVSPASPASAIDRTVLDGDGVHPVPRLDDPVAAHLDDDCLHGRRSLCPGEPRPGPGPVTEVSRLCNESVTGQRGFAAYRSRRRPLRAIFR